MDLREAVESVKQKMSQEEEARSLEMSQQTIKEGLNKYYQIPEDDPSVTDIQKLSDIITGQLSFILEDKKNPLTLEKVQVCDALVSLLNKYRSARSGVAIASKFNYGLFNE